MSSDTVESAITAEGISDKAYSFARVYQPLPVTAKLKVHADDFIVEENIPLDLSGDGEHCWIYIKKTGCNTDWLAQQIAKYCGIKKMAVAYAGLKDRHAVTSQWFSVQLPGKPMPDWRKFEASFAAFVAAGKGMSGDAAQEKIQVLKSFRHNKKLQRGALKSNAFTIRLRALSDSSDEMFECLQQRCTVIAEKGVPNYFGSQRFGRNYNNLEQALKLFSKPRYKIAKHKRGIYLSAARSWLFNHILAERVTANVWDARLPGDVYMLAGRSACFVDEPQQCQDIEHRLAANEIHPTAALWGEGDAMVVLDAAALEGGVIDQFADYRDGLIAARLQASRRACRVVPEGLNGQRQGNDFVLTFSLPAGSYATMVLAEIFSAVD